MNKLLIEIEIKKLFKKIFEGVYFIVEKSQDKQQLLNSLKKFESDFISSFKL